MSDEAQVRMNKAFREAERKAARAVASESVGLISECCEDIRLGLVQPGRVSLSDKGDQLIDDARKRLLTHVATLRILHLDKS